MLFPFACDSDGTVLLLLLIMFLMLLPNNEWRWCKYTDTSVTNRIIPLVHPSNLQITSRGRVVFSILPSGQMNSLNDITSYISFLPPEYLNNIGKKITFIESDVEKVRLAHNTQAKINK